MNKIGKVLFPIAAVIVAVTAIADQQWLRLGIAAIFVLATIQIFKAEAAHAEASIDQEDTKD